VAVFLLALVLLRWLAPRLPVAATLAVAAAAAAPLAIAMVYDRLTGLKTPWFEISLTVATVEVESTLAVAVQHVDSSATPQLVDYIARAIADQHLHVVEVNLRQEPDWWSTRLYLLAALAADYTAIRRLVFVSGGAERRYVGMAAPAGIRRELAARFPTYERTYTRQRVDLQPEQRPQDQVRQILYGWPPALQNTAGQDEPALRQLVTTEMLREWVDLELDPAALEWDGGPDDARLRYRIIERGDPYTALVYQGRLQRVVSRSELAAAVATSALRRSAPQSPGSDG
jgi:hypothetical protein